MNIEIASLFISLLFQQSNCYLPPKHFHVKLWLSCAFTFLADLKPQNSENILNFSIAEHVTAGFNAS